VIFIFTFSAVTGKCRLDLANANKPLAKDGCQRRQESKKNMDISRKLGILVFCGVPAIIGGGIVYGIAGSYVPVAVYEILLYLCAGAIVSK
jgi:hypothetical protein